MKRIANAILLTGALTLVVSGPAAAADDNWSERRFQAKYGRPSPAKEAQLKAEKENTAYRAEPRTVAPTNRVDEQFKAKLGRNSPAEEARIKAERDSTAYRAEPAPKAPARSWSDELHYKKYGRYPGK